MKELHKKELLDILLDENNKQEITLTDRYGKVVNFEQLATIPYYDQYNDEEFICTILHPLTLSKEFDPNYIYPFMAVKDENENYTLEAIEDETIIKYLEKEYNKE